MKIQFLPQVESQIVAFLIEENGELPLSAKDLDDQSDGLLTEALTTGRFKGSAGQVVTVVLPKSTGVNRAVLVGLGKFEEDKPNNRLHATELAAGHLAKEYCCSGFESLSIHVDSSKIAVSAAIGAKLAVYQYNEWFTKKKEEELPSVKEISIILEDHQEAQKEWERAGAAIEGTYLARDLVNTPPNVLFPESFANQIKFMESMGVAVEVLDEDEMSDLGMGSLLGVGQGSDKESQLAIMKWNGADSDTDPVMLVGKGVCFDTGGISLKPGEKMEEMRGDMGGAAAVTGTIKALALRKAKVNVVGIVGLVENMPDGNAIRPGDILVSGSGQTIEVQNTDAEGRLVLADALWYAQEYFKPKVIVDLATLTGAILISLGHSYAGMFSNDDDLAKELSDAGAETGEKVWRLPMGEEYDKLIKSQFADMKNIGGRAAGSITAAQFLKRFIRDGVRWAHLDIAGVAWVDKDKSPTDPSWGSGFGPRLLDRWIANHYEE